MLTIIGEPEPLRDAVVESIGRAVELIDMTKHQGQHPRMGCVDVVPFIPIRNTTVGDADRIAKETAQLASQRFGQPFFLYEKSATAPHRANLADVRKGQFEGMAEKMKDPMWRPDYGPATIHPTGGVTAIGARMPLIAYNINLDTPNVEIASAIAKTIRNMNGGFRYCKAMGVHLEDRNLAQVSAVMKDAGRAHMGVGIATGREKAEQAAMSAVASPLLETSINGATGVLVNVTGSPELTLDDVETAASIVQEAANPEANIIFGATYSDEFEDEMRVTVIATGFESKKAENSTPSAKSVSRPGPFTAAGERAKPTPVATEDVDDIDEIFKIFNR